MTLPYCPFPEPHRKDYERLTLLIKLSDIHMWMDYKATSVYGCSILPTKKPWRMAHLPPGVAAFGRGPVKRFSYATFEAMEKGIMEKIGIR